MNKQKLIALLSVGKSWQTVTAPDAVFSYVPFTIQQSGRRFRPAPGWDLRTHANVTVSKTVWVATDGNDANSGLTEALAKRKISSAMAVSGVDRIMIKAGVYTYGYGVDGAALARNCEFIGHGGDVVIAPYQAGLTWTLVGNHYTASMAADVAMVLDSSSPDALGDFARYTAKASEAQVDAAPGSWWWSSGVLYVRTSDGRAPDSNILPFTFFGNLRNNTAGVTYYMENLTFYGGGRPYLHSGAVDNIKSYAKNCVFKYSNSDNSVYIIGGGGEAIFQNCLAACAVQDGFKVVESSGHPTNLVLIDCIGRSNGKAGDTVMNGYSRHDGGSTVIIGGEYYNNYGANIHDIDSDGVGADPYTWCLGVNCHHSLSATATNRNFAIGIGGTGGSMWLDCCTSSGSITDAEVDTNAELYIRNFISSGVFIGTPVPY